MALYLSVYVNIYTYFAKVTVSNFFSISCSNSCAVWVWLCTSLIPALQKERQRIVNSQPAELHRVTLSQNTKINKQINESLDSKQWIDQSIVL
jgi:hypothetical protein